MGTKHKSTHSAKPADENSAGSSPFRDAPAGTQQMVEQRERLGELKACEEEIAALERRRCELEVECIEKEVRIKGGVPLPGLDQSQAAEIADALQKKRELEAVLLGHKPEGAGRSAAGKEREQLKLGLEALAAWIDAPNTARPQPILKIFYVGVMIATLVVIWSAIFVHPVLLLVLVGLGVVLTFLRSFNQNEAWVRLGAKRQFNATELKPLSSWSETAVHERAAELETRIDALAHHEVKPELPLDEVHDEADELERHEVEFAMAEMHLAKLLSGAHLDINSIDVDTLKWLGDLTASRHARWELDRIIVRLRALIGQRDRTQDMLFRFLTRQGEAPKGGSADYASFSAGLDRVAARSGR